MPKNESHRNCPPPRPEDYEPYIDPIGVTHWLPPKRCKNCDD